MALHGRLVELVGSKVRIRTNHANSPIIEGDVYAVYNGQIIVLQDDGAAAVLEKDIQDVGHIDDDLSEEVISTELSIRSTTANVASRAREVGQDTPEGFDAHERALKRSNIDDESASKKRTKQAKCTELYFHMKMVLGTPKNQPENIPTISWLRRYFLFDRFDDGVQLDEESWYSVTPQSIAKRIAQKSRCDLILDACAGAGGNSIQFAQTCHHVIACEVNSRRLAMAKQNASIYGVHDRIEFVLGSCADLMCTMQDKQVDVVFLSPPWGGPEYKNGNDKFSLEKHVQLSGGWNGVQLFKEARRVARFGVALFLPRTSTPADLLLELGEEPSAFEYHVLKSGQVFTTCAYFGDFV